MSVRLSDEISYTRAFWAGVALTVVAWLIPFGFFVTYPFSLLATWAHEMGHGMFSLLGGGEFRQLEVFANLSGLARVVPGGALTSAGGLIGAPLLGAVVIAIGPRSGWSRAILIALGGLLGLSVAIWVRNPYGVVAVSLLALAFWAASWRLSEKHRFVLVQFVGIQLALSALVHWRYLFMGSVTINGQKLLSDTGAIEYVLGAPYWVWGALILAFNLALLYGAYRLVRYRLGRQTIVRVPQSPLQ